MFHQDLAPILRECGLSTVGENVAYGYPERQVGRQRRLDEAPTGTGRTSSTGTSGCWRSVPGRATTGTWYAAQVFGRKAR